MTELISDEKQIVIVFLGENLISLRFLLEIYSEY